jgi:hypothetical protein
MSDNERLAAKRNVIAPLIETATEQQLDQIILILFGLAETRAIKRTNKKKEKALAAAAE